MNLFLRLWGNYSYFWLLWGLKNVFSYELLTLVYTNIFHFVIYFCLLTVFPLSFFAIRRTFWTFLRFFRDINGVGFKMFLSQSTLVYWCIQFRKIFLLCIFDFFIFFGPFQIILGLSWGSISFFSLQRGDLIGRSCPSVCLSVLFFFLIFQKERFQE